jgi:PD-(D/E)XK nuclease superfamily protein
MFGAVNPRRQGDLGEYSAIEWLWSRGCPVWYPLGHSPDVDLVARVDGRLVGIQVKTSTVVRGRRFEVTLCTRGGNRSWSGLVKRFSPERCD